MLCPAKDSPATTPFHNFAISVFESKEAELSWKLCGCVDASVVESRAQMGFCLPSPHRYSKYHNGCPLHARTPRRALLEEGRKGLLEGVLRERNKQLWSANLLHNFCFVLKRMIKRFTSVKKMLAFYSEITLHVKFCLDFFSSYCTFVFHRAFPVHLNPVESTTIPPSQQPASSSNAFV